jgi:hypothetical protein
LRNSHLSLPSSGKRHANRTEYEKQRRDPGQAQVGDSLQIKDRYDYRTNQEKDSKQSQYISHWELLPYHHEDSRSRTQRPKLLRRVSIRHWNAVHLFSLSQSMSESLNGGPALTGPEAKNDLRKIDHITVSESAGTRAPGKLQFNDAFDLRQRCLNRTGLVMQRVWNNGPAAFILVSQPFDGPLVDPARTGNQPGAALVQKRRKMLFKEVASCLAIDVSGSGDCHGTSADYWIGVDVNSRAAAQ